MWKSERHVMMLSDYRGTESLLYNEFEQYALEKLERLTHFSPPNYNAYKEHVGQTILRLLRRKAFDTLVETSMLILDD